MNATTTMAVLQVVSVSHKLWMLSRTPSNGPVSSVGPAIHPSSSIGQRDGCKWHTSAVGERRD